MNFAQQQADPRRHVVGIAAVILLHILVIWALLTGLGKRVIDIVRAPIETKVIEEIKKPPPPPEVVLPPPPKLEAPPPPFIPPPEIQIATPPPAPTITATTIAPPPAPMVPTAPPQVAAPAPPAPPAVVSVGAACPNYVSIVQEAGFPADANRAGLERGEVLIEFTVTASGDVKDVHALNSTNSMFTRAAMRSVPKFKCVSQGHDFKVQVPLVYKLE